MKKLICLILAFAMAACFAACGESEQPGNTDTAPATEPPVSGDNTLVQEGFVFNYNGTAIAMNAEAAPIIAELGEPKNYTEETSCAFTGLDKTYYYGSFYLQTYPVAEKDYVYALWFADDSVTTQEGLYVGMTQAAAEAICGADSYNGTNAYIQTKGESRLTVIIKDGVVFSIQYDAVVE